MDNKSVLVTGGAGYIGSHVVLELLSQGYSVVVLDNLSTGVKKNVSPWATFVHGDVSGKGIVRQIIDGHGISAVMHFAGSVVVPESVADPLKYYKNNTEGSRALIETCVEAGVKHFVFSSSAAVYGVTETSPVSEDAPTVPIAPYGWSKLMTEQMLKDVSQAHDFRYVALRYFNVAGADPEGRTGQSTPNATHLIKRAVQVALGKDEALSIFGTDYATPDGTAVRDYIHVSDLARAHLLVLDALRNGTVTADIFNCGYGHGVSVQQVVDAVGRVTGKNLPTVRAPRRAGDSDSVVADSSKLQKLLGWQPQYDDLDEIVRSALEWERYIT